MLSWFGKGTVIFLLMIPGYLSCQEYPEWFIFQEKVNIAPTIVGYSCPFLYNDSSAEQAFNNGCVNYARQLATNFSGGQAFWATEIGTFWMGADFAESFDTTAISIGVSSLQVLDTFITNQIVTVLLSPIASKLNPKNKRMISLKELKTPKWIKSVPKDNQYDYAVGVAPDYYYEPSSWLEAERIARKNLACNQYVAVKALQKTSNQFQEIRYEETQISLNNIEVVSRWRDLENGIFYVLIRMLKNNYGF